MVAREDTDSYYCMGHDIISISAGDTTLLLFGDNVITIILTKAVSTEFKSLLYHILLYAITMIMALR